MAAGVCALYEKELKRLNPNVGNITYDVSELYTFLDQMTDLSCLVCVHTSPPMKTHRQPEITRTPSAWHDLREVRV